LVEKWNENLFEDKAALMSFANVFAVSQAAKTKVLIGDPQQLEQPIQGSHPEGTDIARRVRSRPAATTACRCYPA
jgi:uncharacterized protein